MTQFPLEVNADLLKQGERRFNTYCTPCHGPTGVGGGMVVQREDRIATSIHEDRIRTMPAGEIFNTVSNGIRNMPGYSSQIDERDRWAIVAYVRALQRSQNGKIEDVSGVATRVVGTCTDCGFRREEGRQLMSAHTTMTSATLPPAAQLKLPDGAFGKARAAAIVAILLGSRVVRFCPDANLGTSPASASLRLLVAVRVHVLAEPCAGRHVLRAIQHLTRSGWSVVIRRVAEALASTLPLFILFFVPVILSMSHVYPWTNPEVVAKSHALTAKAAYLNDKFFMVRAAFYLIVWTLLLLFGQTVGQPRLHRRRHTHRSLAAHLATWHVGLFADGHLRSV